MKKANHSESKHSGKPNAGWPIGAASAVGLVLILIVIIAIICQRQRANRKRDNSAVNAAWSKEKAPVDDGGAFSNTIYSDGQGSDNVAFGIRTGQQNNSTESEGYQELSGKPQQRVYQDLKNHPSHLNENDDYVDPNNIRATDDADYIDVDSEFKENQYTYVDLKKDDENKKSEPEYFQLEKPTNDEEKSGKATAMDVSAISGEVEPEYFQLEKDDNIADEEDTDGSIQDYDRLDRSAKPTHQSKEGTAEEAGTYQHLQAHAAAIGGDEDYQHLQRGL